MDLSLKKIFMVLFIMAITSLLTLSAFALYFNTQLIKNQNLLADAIKIGVARHAMNTALSQFFSRQEKILIARNLTEISSIGSRSVAENYFKSGVKELADLTKANSNLDKVLQSVMPAYQGFLNADQQLLDLSLSRIRLKMKLDAEVGVIDNTINAIRSNTEKINGKIILLDVQNKNKLKLDLLSPALLNNAAKRDQFKLKLNDYLANSGNDDSSETLNAEFLELSYFVRKLIETNNPDAVTDLQYNEIVQVLNLIQEDLDNLTTTFKTYPELNAITQEINIQWNALKLKMKVTSPGNFITSRVALSRTEEMLQETIKQIQKDQINLLAQFNTLDVISEKIRSDLQAKAQMIAKRNRFMIISIMLSFFSLMILLGYFLLRNMTNTLKALEILNEKLLVTARKAGMAEIASSVLHNIGNVLNSINVSIGLLKENVGQSDFKKLIATSEIIETQMSDLPHFLAEDEKGKYIPQYLIGLIKLISVEREKELSEINRISVNIKLVENIVVMQQSISGVKIFLERVYLPDLLAMALQVCASFLKRNAITLQEEFRETPYVVTDKSKVIQILINLIQNAIDALNESSNIPKRIAITVQKYITGQAIEIRVSDNGIGISAENLKKMFSFGFTTKLEGHGFGLHSSILAAKELGGELRVSSEGLGKGTTFTFILPLITKLEKTVYEAKV
jgi:signal transduction histidine kinase